MRTKIRFFSVCLRALLTASACVLSVSGCGKGGGAFDKSKTISVISREDGSGTRGAFIELFGIEAKENGTKRDMTTKDADIVNKTDVMLVSVADNPYAIGYVSIGSLNAAVKALPVGGAAPSRENVKNGSYKIFRPFTVAVKSGAPAAVNDFLNYISSASGQDVADKSYIKINDAAPAYAPSGASGRVVVCGSSSVAPLMEKLIEAYNAVNADVVIELLASDSTAGINAVIEGTCDIAMASRALSDKEAALLVPVDIALDGIAVIVNNKNPLSEISMEQVKNIYTGNLTKWNEI